MAVLSSTLRATKTSFQVSQSLLVTEHQLNNLRFELIGTVGVVKRIDSGWPLTPLPARTPPSLPLVVSASVMKCFKIASDRVIRNCMVFEQEFRDHDLEDFLDLSMFSTRDTRRSM